MITAVDLTVEIGNSVTIRGYYVSLTDLGALSNIPGAIR
jgi:hypothetical protein